MSVSHGSSDTFLLHWWSEGLSKERGIAFCTTLALEGILVVLTNCLTIVLFTLNKKLRKRSLILVVNMAVVDLVLGAVILPTYVYITGNNYELWTARVQVTLGLLIPFTIVQIVFLHGSLLSAALISLERFYAIYWPLRHRTLTKRTYCNVIVIMWTVSLVLSVMPIGSLFTEKVYALYGVVLHFCFLLLIVCCCNIGIWIKFRNRGFASEQQNRASQGKRLTKTLLFVSSVALLSWLPLIIALVVAVSTEFSPSIEVALRITVVLNYCNAFCNPVVYALRIPEFRQAFHSCFKRKTAINLEPNIGSVNSAAISTQDTKL